MKVSRSVSNIDMVAPFYIDILESTEVHEEVFDDGTKLKIINAPGSTVHLQFWEGVATGEYKDPDEDIAKLKLQGEMVGLLRILRYILTMFMMK